MRWLKRTIPTLLVLAALAVVLATLFSDHRADYGRVQLPQGGLVDLPEGAVKVYVEEPNSSSDARMLSGPLRFQARPRGGGEPVAASATAKDGSETVQTERSQEMRERGSVAELEVPAAGLYAVGGRLGAAPPGTAAELSFGLDPFIAIAHRWRLLAGLIGGAVLISLIPLAPPRSRQRWDVRDEHAG